MATEDEEFKDFAKRWEAIHEEGESKSWLRWEGGYEGELVPYSPAQRRATEAENARLEALIKEQVKREAEKARKNELYLAETQKLRDRIYGKRT